ncbi:unnamed protein product [Closterium sp. NIES-64]|nr:unnamed protein product [Closterium sp. NIES-64]
MTVFREPESPASAASASPRAQRKHLLPRPVLDAVAGAVSGGVARLVVSPLDVIKIRFQVPPAPCLAPSRRFVFAARLAMTPLRDYPNGRALISHAAAALTPPSSRSPQVQLEPIHAPHAAAAATSAAGRAAATAAAGAVRASRSKYTGLLQAAREILREEGVQGFWRGTVPGLLLVMPYTAIQFVVIHRFKSLMTGSHRTEDHKQLRPELSFVGGSVAGMAATVGSYPFDLLRTVLASQGEPKVYAGMRAACMGIVRERGVRGLFAGLPPTMVEIIPYAGLQFGLYDAFKRHLAVRAAPHPPIPPSPHPPHPPFGLYDAFKRHLAQKCPTLLSGGREAPVAALRCGGEAQRSRLLTDLALIPAAPPAVASAVERAARPAVSSGQLSAWQQFMCGLAAGTLAKVACHPLDVVKKRFQVEGLRRHPRYGARIQPRAYRGMVDALRKIVATEGVEGLYKGVLPSVIKAAPSAAITFFVYELVAKFLEEMSSTDV